MTILRQCNDYSWLLPRFFLHRDSHLFFAFTNVQSLTVESLEIHKFIPELNRYFGHLSPTLRSLTLHIPHGTPRHLSHFISLFPNLNDVKIRSLIHSGLGVPDDTLVPFSAPKFEGRLTLLSFAAEADETWEQLATSTFVPRVALKISEQRMRELKYAVGKVNTDLPLLPHSRTFLAAGGSRSSAGWQRFLDKASHGNISFRRKPFEPLRDATRPVIQCSVGAAD